MTSGRTTFGPVLPAAWAEPPVGLVTLMKSSCMPPNIICRAIAPATATVMPLTARAAEPLLNWSRRVASCQGTGPPRSRATTASTSHGSSAVSPKSTRMEPAAMGTGRTWCRFP